eukprot:TRINITY_DN6249_c0_g1_i1.p1 TRINITY_DN6249_c0_g1~~TRINITY_DN6249_c0_g1_i1.p1  ORF type:complete len:321 (-),score=62.52 TRINITY_DN6249_c0_g1_i1:205-1167(-)
MRIISWNVNGIRAMSRNIDEDSLLLLFQKLEADIICMQETKVSRKSDVPEEILHVDGFESFWSFCKVKRGYSGVVTYVKKKLTVNATVAPFNDSKYDDEGRIIVTDHHDFLLCNVYFPNGASGEVRRKYKLDFYTKFEELCQSYVNEGRSVVIVGDVNTAYDDIDVHKTPEELGLDFQYAERIWMTRFFELGYVDVFRHFHPQVMKFSWWDPKTRKRRSNLGWRIDYCIISNDYLDRTHESDILTEQYGSDHCPVYIDLDIGTVPKHKTHNLSSEYKRQKQSSIMDFFSIQPAPNKKRKRDQLDAGNPTVKKKKNNTSNF